MGPRAATAGLNPQTPAPGRGPGRKAAVPEVGELGQVTFALLCPKTCPTFPTGAGRPQPARGVVGNRNS